MQTFLDANTGGDAAGQAEAIDRHQASWDADYARDGKSAALAGHPNALGRNRGRRTPRYRKAGRARRGVEEDGSQVWPWPPRSAMSRAWFRN